MNDVVEISFYNSVYLQFRIINTEIYEKIVNHFTFEKQTWKNRRPSISRFCLVHYRKFLYRGLLGDLVQLLDDLGIAYTVDEKLTRKSDIDPLALDTFIEKLNLRLTPHYYQKEAVMEVLRSHNNIILSATSSGKSLVIGLVILAFLFSRKNPNQKVLLIVPDKGLVAQMYCDLVDYFSDTPNIDIRNMMQMIHSDIPKKKRDYTKPIIITTWGSQKGTNETFKDLFDEEFLDNVGCLIYDEVHTTSAKVAREIVSSCRKTLLRVGTTGTMHEEEEELKNTQIRGMFGEIIHSISARDMIDGGFASEVKIYQLILDFGKQVRMSYQDEVKFVEDNENFLDYMVDFVGQTKTGNSMCLYRHIPYAKRFQRKMMERHPHKKVFRIDMTTPAKKRKEIFDYMNNHDNVILMGTYHIIATGMSIKRLHYAFLLQGMKKKIKVIQGLGRILRLHESKTVAKLFDFVPKILYTVRGRDGNFYSKDGYLYSHFLVRNDLYMKEGHDCHVKIINGWNKNK